MGAFRAKVGERLRQLRKAAGLTQEQLAKRAGMDYKYLGSIERGERNVTLDNLERVSRALGVAPYEPFLFPDRADGRPPDDDVLLDLIRHSDPAVRPVVVEIVHSLLRFSQSSKRGRAAKR